MINYLKKHLKHWLLRRKFPNSLIYFGVAIDKTSILGKNTVLFSDVALQNASVGDYSYVQAHSVLNHVNIDKFCSIASNVHIGLANHPIDMISTSPIFYDCSQPLPAFFVNQPVFSDVIKETRISADVWIGQGVMIKSGVNIGVGAVIGAGAVVTKDVEPYSVVVGIPARHIKYRFEALLRDKLLKSEWWELSENKLIKLSSYFHDPEKFLEILGKDK